VGLLLAPGVLRTQVTVGGVGTPGGRGKSINTHHPALPTSYCELSLPAMANYKPTKKQWAKIQKKCFKARKRGRGRGCTVRHGSRQDETEEGGGGEEG
jgi:hypothetical protein